MKATNSAPASLFNRGHSAFSAPGYQRSRAVRRLAATVLFFAALASGLASLRTSDPAIVTFSGDVPAGTVLTDEHVELTRVPTRAVPSQSTSDRDAVVGQVTTAHGSSGQPVALNQLLGIELTAGFALPSPPGGEDVTHTMVPVKLAEPGIIPLLHPGDEVNVISSSDDGTQPRVIATGGRVILADTATVDSADSLLVLLRESDAHAVASASLNQPLTVVLTGDRARPAGTPSDLE